MDFMRYWIPPRNMFILIRTKFLNINGLWSQASYDQYLIYGETFRETLLIFQRGLYKFFTISILMVIIRIILCFQGL